MIITKRHLSRRAVLKGIGVTVGLPFLEAMVPAATALAQTAAKGKLRFVAVEMVHGAAGSTNYGLQHNLWSPSAVGGSFDLAPTALAPLDPVREYVTIVSNTDARMAEAFTTPEIGGDHFRASSVFLTQSHPKQTMGSDLYVGTSFDQVYAKQFGQDTAIPSMQLSIEAVDHSGGCEYNYSCAYTDAISWASPSEPLPMLRDPRAVFDALFGVGATPVDRARRRREDTSVLDTIVSALDRLKRQVGGHLHDREQRQDGAAVRGEAAGDRGRLVARAARADRDENLAIRLEHMSGHASTLDRSPSTPPQDRGRRA